MMAIVDPHVDTTRSGQTLCWMIAAALHGLMLYWNPIVLSSDFKTTHEFVNVDIIEQNLPSEQAEPPQPKQKLGLMDSLKEMLMKPKMEEIAHTAPEPVAPKVAAPVAPPALREKSMNRAMPTFKPTSQTDDLAAMNSPSAIQTPTRNTALPTGGPTLKIKSFGGIRVKDMPFQMGAPGDTLASGNATVIPVAVGQRSAKAALGYSNPSLQDSGKQRFAGLTPRLGGGTGELSASGASGSIALSGTGGTGNAPTGAYRGASLNNRPGSGLGSGGGLVSRSGGFGSGGGVGSAITSLPSAAAELDKTLAATAAATITKSNKKGFDIAGPLNNRTITRKKIPQYPSWAEEQGIIGSVRIYFTVTPEGAVRSNMQIRKTTGYPELDKLAMEALSEWKFAPFNAEDESSQWGIITFTFSLAS